MVVLEDLTVLGAFTTQVGVQTIIVVTQQIVSIWVVDLVTELVVKVV